MKDEITHGAGGTTFAGEKAVNVFACLVVANAMKMYATTGIPREPELHAQKHAGLRRAADGQALQAHAADRGGELPQRLRQIPTRHHPGVHTMRHEILGPSGRFGDYRWKCECGQVSRPFDRKRQAEDDAIEHDRQAHGDEPRHQEVQS